jgi:hypothetical protein
MGDDWKKWYKFEGDEDRFDFFIFILLKPFSTILPTLHDFNLVCCALGIK